MPFNPFNFWYKAFNPMLSVLTGVTNAFGQSIFLGLLAMLLMLFLAPRADRVAHAIISQPVAAGDLGLLTLVVVPVILVALGLLSPHYHPGHNGTAHHHYFDSAGNGSPVWLDRSGI